jgi:2-polyprenyl-3-methyl-5-hydroxy-6-metoxy-1,4-benzoquinol methylase
LTERQRREQKYHDEAAARFAPTDVCFDPVLGREHRPWNPYWFLCETVQREFRSEEQRLLDFGCGTGSYSVIFASVGFDTYGFDISHNNIRVSRGLAEKYRISGRIHQCVGAAESLPFPADFFDVIAGVDILHHVDIGPAIRECHRVLKAGGVAVFKEPVEAAVFDSVRNTRLGKWLRPNTASLDRHITTDERKLTTADLKLIHQAIPKTSFKPFRLFSRLSALLPARVVDGSRSSSLEKIDEMVLNLLPFMGRYAGSIVVILRK